MLVSFFFMFIIVLVCELKVLSTFVIIVDNILGFIRVKNLHKDAQANSRGVYVIFISWGFLGKGCENVSEYCQSTIYI